MRKWIEWLRLRFSGSLATEGSMALPAPMGQHYEETEREKWKREHGFSAAFAPMPWSEDIAKHNHAIDTEYAEEIETRKAAYTAGTYQPKVLVLTGEVSADRVEAIMQGARPLADEINWHLDLTADPGRRLNLTHVQPPPPIPPEVLAQAREAGNLARRVKLEEVRQGLDPDRPAILDQVLGSRRQVLEAVGGDAQRADQLEAVILAAHEDAQRLETTEAALKDVV